MSPWEQLWPALEHVFEDARRELQARGLRVRLETTRGSNASFPFRACASFGVDDEVEIVAVSIDALTENDRFRLNSDVTRADGELLAEMAERVIPGAEIDARALDAWIADIGAFVRGNLGTIAAALAAHQRGV